MKFTTQLLVAASVALIGSRSTANGDITISQKGQEAAIDAFVDGCLKNTLHLGSCLAPNAAGKIEFAHDVCGREECKLLMAPEQYASTIETSCASTRFPLAQSASVYLAKRCTRVGSTNCIQAVEKSNKCIPCTVALANVETRYNMEHSASVDACAPNVVKEGRQNVWYGVHKPRTSSDEDHKHDDKAGQKPKDPAAGPDGNTPSPDKGGEKSPSDKNKDHEDGEKSPSDKNKDNKDSSISAPKAEEADTLSSAQSMSANVLMTLLISSVLIMSI